MRYPGGKGKCYQQLINLMPPHDTYIESHIGGGAVLRNKKLAKRNIGIDRDPAIIEFWRSQNIPRSEFILDDALTYLAKHQFSGNELIYADPPYIPSTRRRERVYKYDYTVEDHEALLGKISGTPCMVMLSGYDNDLYNDILRDWRKITFESATHTGIRTECVWINFPPPEKLHDYSHIGSSFRERQTIKRRQHRLRERIRNMNSTERNEFLLWLNESYNER